MIASRFFTLITATVIALPAVFVPQAALAACDSSFYNHNGSRMEIHACTNGKFTIEYDAPRSGMRKQGVTPGTLLFRGNFWESGGVNLRKVNGTAYVFKRGCKPAGYKVSGYWLEDGTLEMNGSAPVRGSGCKITRYRQDNLVFSGM